ncbi:30S ribosomal protein S20 [Candidatus Fermentibacteria bacterium]|nr:30S ribosomal protein S20 [Candidatus Fermentibacteria bacterium]
MKRQKNRSELTRLRTAIKAVEEAKDDEERQKAYRHAQSLLDKAGRKRLIHPRKARRLKKRLSRAE